MYDTFLVLLHSSVVHFIALFICLFIHIGVIGYDCFLLFSKIIK